MTSPAGHKSFSDAAVLITGGGSGIGRGIALAFAHCGARVMLTGRRRAPLEATMAEIRRAEGRCAFVRGDVSKAADCKAIVKACVRQWGALHILINNAGIARFGALTETPDRDLIQMLEINLRGAMLMTKYAVPMLARHKAARTASIINIGTSAATAPVKDFSAYSSAKAGLIQFSRCMALELAGQGIRVNCVNPGVVETPIFDTMLPPAARAKALARYAAMTPLGRIGQPADIAAACLFLSGAKAAWITGAVLAVDGGIGLT